MKGKAGGVETEDSGETILAAAKKNQGQTLRGWPATSK